MSWMRFGPCCAIVLLVTLAASSSKAVAAKWTLQQLPPRYLDETRHR